MKSETELAFFRSSTQFIEECQDDINGPKKWNAGSLWLKMAVGTECLSLYKASLSDSNPCSPSCCHYPNPMNPIVLRQGNFLPASHTKVSVGKQAVSGKSQAGSCQVGEGARGHVGWGAGNHRQDWQCKRGEMGGSSQGRCTSWWGRSAMRSGEGAGNFKSV